MNNYKHFQFFIQNYFINSNDYEDPFKQALMFFTKLWTLRQKKIYYYFKQGVFEDKKGWFTKEAQVKSPTGIDHTRFEIIGYVADNFSTT